MLRFVGEAVVVVEWNKNVQSKIDLYDISDEIIHKKIKYSLCRWASIMQEIEFFPHIQVCESCTRRRIIS